MNLCTVSIGVAPEAERCRKPVSLRYLCCAGGSTVEACDHYKPLVMNGETCQYECKWFRAGCTCPAAKKKARERAKTLLAACL